MVRSIARAFLQVHSPDIPYRDAVILPCLWLRRAFGIDVSETNQSPPVVAQIAATAVAAELLARSKNVAYIRLFWPIFAYTSLYEPLLANKSIVSLS